MWPSTLRGDAHPAGSQVTLRGGAVVAWWPPLRLAGAGEPGSAVSGVSSPGDGMIRRVVQPLAGLWAARRATPGNQILIDVNTRA